MWGGPSLQTVECEISFDRPPGATLILRRFEAGTNLSNRCRVAPINNTEILQTRAALTRIPTRISAPVATRLLDVLDVSVSSLQFFESPQQTTPLEQRVYRETFDSKTTRYIMWQLKFVFPPPKRRVDFTIHAAYFQTSMKILGEQDVRTRETYTLFYF